MILTAPAGFAALLLVLSVSKGATGNPAGLAYCKSRLSEGEAASLAWIANPG